MVLDMDKTGFVKKCKRFIDEKKLIEKNDLVVVALSGGADSVCLLHLLNDLKDEYGIELVVVHVHHGLRGDEADRDEMFARSLSGTLKIPYVCERCEVSAYANEKKMTLEEAGRVLRYEALDRVANERGANKIAIAHHLDDQVETVMMNLLRGTGPMGLSGINPRRGMLIRPLLAVSKEEIKQYLRGKDQPYMTDSTNESDEYTRNRIRKELLPLAIDIYPGAARHIAALTEDMGEWRNEIESSVEKCKNILEDNGKIIISEYIKENYNVRHAVLKSVIESVIPGAKDVKRSHYLKIDALAFETVKGEKTLALPQGIVVRRQYGRLVVEKTEDAEGKICENLQISGSTIVTCGEKNIVISTEIIPELDFENIFREKDYTKYINYDRIENGLVIRHPKEGDYFEIDKEGNTKKLSRYYIDKKIPKSKRSKCLVIADGSHVVWALYDRQSYKYRVSEDTKAVLRISVKETPNNMNPPENDAFGGGKDERGRRKEDQ